MLVAPVLSSFFFRKGVSEWHNPVMESLKTRYREAARWAIEHRLVTVGVAATRLGRRHLSYGGRSDRF